MKILTILELLLKLSCEEGLIFTNELAVTPSMKFNLLLKFCDKLSIGSLVLNKS